MRLHLGYQNLIGKSGTVLGGDTNTMAGWDVSLYGVDIAPDGSSNAEGYYYTSAWGNINTDSGRTDLDSGEHIYIFGNYIKPTSDTTYRHILYAKGDTDANSFSYNIHFSGKVVTSDVQNPWGDNDDCLEVGYTQRSDGWTYAYMVCDFRNKPVATIRFLNYVNASVTGFDAAEGAYVWGFTLEKTQERRLAGPPIITGTNIRDNGDFSVVDFTQLPSNIEDIENDVKDIRTTLDGSINKVSTHIDTNLKKLVWGKINYTKHGKMLYNIREGLRDKIGQDCVLFYPTGFKSKIDYSFIRIVDFRFEYTEIPNIASVEVDYYVISSHGY